jgi:hypothetical protein
VTRSLADFELDDLAAALSARGLSASHARRVLSA